MLLTVTVAGDGAHCGILIIERGVRVGFGYCLLHGCVRWVAEFELVLALGLTVFAALGNGSGVWHVILWSVSSNRF